MPKRTIRPLYSKVVVRRIEAEKQSKGGIFIPENAKEKPVEAVVLAIGHGKMLPDGKLIALEVKVGDRVLVHKYGGSEVTIDGQELLIIHEDELLAILE